MRPRTSLLKKIWRKLRGGRDLKAKQPAERRVFPTLEPLEGRIAPATIINANTIVFQDLDHDIVTVKFSKPLFDLPTDAAKIGAAQQVLKFSDANNAIDVGKVLTPSTTLLQQLQLIDLTQARLANGINVAIGTTVTVTVAKATTGNGLTDVGYIHAYETNGTKNLALGAVSIAGDLGQIDAGNGSSKVGVASLKVNSLGTADPATTQPAIGSGLSTSRSTVSNIIGSLGSLTVAKDVKGTVKAQNGGYLATIGNITIGGSLIGGAATDSGSIIADSTIGAVKIGTTLATGIQGGSGADSGTIRSGGAYAGKITSLTVSGSIVGGTGAGSAVVSAKTSIGAVKIGGDIDGRPATNVTGVAGIDSQGSITSVAIAGKIYGGAGALDGYVNAGTNLGAVTVNSLVGGAGTNSASVIAGGKLAALTVIGDISAGSGFGSASVSSGTNSELLGDIGAIKIGGKLTGGGVQNSGSISSGGKIASIAVGPAVALDQVVIQGGGGLNSGTIFSRGAIGSVKVTGSIEGGNGIQSGSIVSRDYITSDLERAGSIGAVVISGHVKGGVGDDSGQIRADGHITSVALGTAAIDGDLIAGAGVRSGNIRSGQGIVESGSVGAITIKGDIINTTGAGQAGGIFAEGRIASVSVSKTIDGGTVRAGDDLGALTVTGNVSNAKISARGVAKQGTADLAIGKVTFGGNVATTSIRAGYDTSFVTALNPDAQIGVVSVKGNWTASDLIAGVIDGGAAGFGTAGDSKIVATDNTKIISSIASIVIGGTVTGTAGGTDHFGFVAQKIGPLKIGGITVPLPGTVGVPFDLATGQNATNDVSALVVAV